ncbi:MAG TPA: FAD:protein FMN transferase [Pirellulales bacterium]|jgi:thiamine biosynthesis lipoprotein|nr:FAD:protein FMN transferase [Pirellulales bacterium]
MSECGPSPVEVFHACDAMATRFEICLVGDEREHLDAVANAALEEIARIERLLSRFDPRSEVSRVNRHAAMEPVLVDVELFEILRCCLEWRNRTEGFFDVTADADSQRGELLLDERSRTARFTNGAMRLDFGAFGKGYALDCVVELLGEYSVGRALIHGGTSSVLGLGSDAAGRPWQVGIRAPWQAEDARGGELGQVVLDGRAISTSGVLAREASESDLIDPHLGRRLTGQAACTVVARSAAEAEVLSTALLCMGRERAAAYTARNAGDEWSAAWASIDTGIPRLQWFNRPI